jgi:rhodanese-related sulfurtransferase
VDVRREGEFRTGHVPSAANVPLHQLLRRTSEIERGSASAVICASGYRSSAGASLLAREGFGPLLNMTGGTAAWIRAGLPTT